MFKHEKSNICCIEVEGRMVLDHSANGMIKSNCMASNQFDQKNRPNSTSSLMFLQLNSSF